MLGAAVQPPQPARAALTFQLAQGSAAGTFVPARTRVTAQVGAAQIGFETDDDLTLTDAQLVAALVHDPAADRIGDYTDIATGKAQGSFPAFAGDTPIEHSLYLANDDLLGMPGPLDVTITFFTAEGGEDLAHTSWSYWDGAAWQPAAMSFDTASVSQVSITLTGMPTPAPLPIAGRTARWLRAQPLDGYDLSALEIQWMYLIVTASPSDMLPARGFANTTPVDLTRDFYPFGERPSFNATLYLSLPDAFAVPGARVAIDVTLTNPADGSGGPIPPVAADAAQVRWEAWAGEGWSLVASGTAPAAPESNAVTVEVEWYGSSETTRAFTRSGTVNVMLPDDLARTTVGGVSGYWLRARLVGGDYGKDAYYEPTPVPNPPPGTVYALVPASFAPPSIASLRLNCTMTRVAALSAWLTTGDGGYEDRTDNDWFSVSYAPHASMLPPPPALTFSEPSDGSPVPSFTPFERLAGSPALYLGFDRPLPNLPATLFLDVDPLLADQAVGASVAAPPRIAWSYATHAGWAPLGVEDETRGLTLPGLLRFIGPADAAPRAVSGRTQYWLRASLDGGPRADSRAAPRLRRALINTTWATAATTIAGETLGASDGSPGQSFRTRRAPVLPGQQIEVFERDIPPDERAALLALEGPDAITPARDRSGHNTGAWIRWRAVPDFYASGPRDRHYCFDHITGEVRFGDGRAGMIPPPGRAAVRAALYRAGGGSGGNVPAGTITRLTSSPPFVAGVTNLAPASGGVDAETVERATRRAAHLLRHGGRAVAAQDYEDMALAASPEVARALAIPAGFPFGQRWIADPSSAGGAGAAQALAAGAGQVGLILVPRSADPQPTPSVELVERVRSYITARCPPTAHLWIGAPGWDRVTITAEVAPISLAAAEGLQRAVLDALRTFLHPLTGGPDGQGWPFGRAPHESDIYALIESIAGVDHVILRRLDTTLQSAAPLPETHSLGRLPPNLRSHFLICSGDHTITLVPKRQGG
jgi:hypothetical protein